MTGRDAHLSEEERQTLADGTMEPERVATASAHLSGCTDCANDIARIRMLMRRARETPIASESLDAHWPAIRSRIEERKVVSLGAEARTRAPHRQAGGRRLLWAGALGAIAAATLVIIVVRGHGRTSIDPTIARAPDTSLSFVAAVDSAKSYEAEAQLLLDRLELQRAMLRPEATRLLERDLRSIDVAIAELKDAIARDPGNATLRQLLAASYRQKIDLLKRAGNAG